MVKINLDLTKKTINEIMCIDEQRTDFLTTEAGDLLLKKLRGDNKEGEPFMVRISKKDCLAVAAEVAETPEEFLFLSLHLIGKVEKIAEVSKDPFAAFLASLITSTNEKRG